MTYGVLPITVGWLPNYTAPWLLTDQLLPMFSTSSTGEEQPTSTAGFSPLPLPSVILLQSGLWDTFSQDAQNMQHWSAAGRVQWQESLYRFMRLVEDTFTTSSSGNDTGEQVAAKPPPELFMRTIPPTNNRNNEQMNEMSMIIRYLVAESRAGASAQYSLRHRWHLVDMAWMLSEANAFAFDGHHYPPAVMYQVFNVLLNQWKQLLMRAKV
jgi:hypothetical protein